MEHSIFSFRLCSFITHLSLQLKAHLKPLLSQFTRSSSFLSVLPVNFYSLLRYFNSSSTHTQRYTRIHTSLPHSLRGFRKTLLFFFFFFATLKISAISLQDLNFASLPWYLRCSFSPLDSCVFPLCLFFDPCFSAKPQFSLASVKPRTLLQLLLKPPFFFSFLFFPILLSHLQPPLKYIHQIIISNQSLVDLIQKDYIQMDFFLVSLKQKDPFLINSINFSKFSTILLYLNV